jgi:hypothetical protein
MSLSYIVVGTLIQEGQTIPIVKESTRELYFAQDVDNRLIFLPISTSDHNMNILVPELSAGVGPWNVRFTQIAKVGSQNSVPTRDTLRHASRPPRI